jgi:hypothetical protein
MNNPYDMGDQDLAIADAIFNVALTGTDAELAARKRVLWTVGITLLADVLLRADPQEGEELGSNVLRVSQRSPANSSVVQRTQA